MKDKLFIDTDIILDIALTREPHFYSSAIISSLIESKSVFGYTSSVIVSNIYYIIRKVDSHKSAIDFISKMRLFINILPVNDEIINLALESQFKDFEDAIQYYCAYNNKIEYLITRNVKDFSKAQMKVHTPDEYLKLKNITDSLDTGG
jgi:predicted nucleic acid-binding protein